MGKSARSNAKKKLRTQRRELVEKKTAWLATAEEKRQAALAACMAAAPPERPPAPEPEAAGDTAMDTADKPVTKKGLKVKKHVMKKGRTKKVNVLSGKSQFYKKGKKGQR